jgi:hypothetical protein
MVRSAFKDVFACILHWSHFVELFDTFVNFVELECPITVVQERTHVESIIIT